MKLLLGGDSDEYVEDIELLSYLFDDLTKVK